MLTKMIEIYIQNNQCNSFFYLQKDIMATDDTESNAIHLLVGENTIIVNMTVGDVALILISMFAV